MEELVKIKNAFVEEIQNGHDHKPSSLPFLVTNLPEKSYVAGAEAFEVLVIGGSNYQKAICQHHELLVKIISKEEGLIPTFRTRDDFVDFVSKHIDPNVKIVALNFAYPIINELRDGKLDGVLMHGTKEHTFDGLVYRQVGLEIEQYMKEKFNREISVYVANDTICLLLSGLTIGRSKNLACEIVGTGYNAAFFLDERTVINLEAANFDKFIQSDIGKKVDQESIHPGKGIFEKEVSGAYLYHHFRIMAEEAKIEAPQVNTTEALNRVAEEQTPLGEIARKVLMRSADLVSTHVAGIADFKKSDMVFVVEGSLFWKGNRYRERVEEMVGKLTTYSVEFVKIEDSGIIGAGVLV